MEKGCITSLKAWAELGMQHASAQACKITTTAVWWQCLRTTAIGSHALASVKHKKLEMGAAAMLQGMLMVGLCQQASHSICWWDKHASTQGKGA